MPENAFFNCGDNTIMSASPPSSKIACMTVSIIAMVSERSVPVVVMAAEPFWLFPARAEVEPAVENDTFDR